LVRNLISPQEQLNKSSSQELHVINTSANSGWMVPGGSLLNMDTSDLESKGAETGLVIEYNEQKGPPIKIQPNQIPAGLDHVSSKAQMNIKAISGINEAMLGQQGNLSRVSGEAIKATEGRVQVQLQSVFDNLGRSRKRVAEFCLHLYQNFYTEQRTFYVANDMLGAKPGTPEFEEITINQQTATGELLNNITVGSYGVVVSTKPAQDSFNDTQFEEAARLKEMGVPVPDDAMIEYSNLSRKRELADRLRNDLSPEQKEAQKKMEALQMATMEKQIERLDAEINRANTGADLNKANARKADLEEERIALQYELGKMKDAMNVDDNAAKLDEAMLESQTDLLLGGLNADVQLKSSKIKAKSTPQARH
jgi:hypothetical protein